MINVLIAPMDFTGVAIHEGAELDYSTAWAIQREVGEKLDHDERCSSVPRPGSISGPGFLCDCGAVEKEFHIRRARAMRTDEDRLRFEPFRGDRDVNIQCRTVRVVTTRKEHWCALSALSGDTHDIPAGERAVCESALVDGEFGTCYYCIPCLDKMMDVEAGYEAGFY